MGQYYEIVSIRRSEPPPGGIGSYWYRYVIAFEGNNTVNGYQQGNIRVVTKAVEDIVTRLNKRYLNKKAPSYGRNYESN